MSIPLGALSGLAMTLVVLNHSITLGLVGVVPPTGLWAGLLVVLQQASMVFVVPTFFIWG
ncbi:MAG: hypothetical protein RMN25_13160 [Anaerolineae bacterium]|nr:hypothetical protein [Thermoflexales bacterium]MDW8408722.1 hypothetical protein [Anaerolineae bacterium]